MMLKYNEQFLDNITNVNIKDNITNDYLILACIKNNLSLLKLQIQKGENLDPSNGPIPLCVASFYGNTTIVSELITNGANVNIKDSEWLTPLHWACLGGHVNVVDILIQNGADVNRRDKYWRTPMHCAAINFKTDCFIKVSSRLFKNYTAADRQGWTPLHHACYHGSIAIAKLMLNEKNLIDMGDRKDHRPLHLAAYCGYKNIVQDLITNGADCNISDKRGFTPLHAAACNGHHVICEELLNHGALVNARTKTNNTALHYAARSNDHSTIGILLKNGADVTIENNRKEKPIHCLCYDEINISNLELFLPYGHLDVKNGKGMTPLHIAAKNGIIEVVKQLLTYNCDPNMTNNCGDTPLHLAVSYNHIDVIDSLLLHYTNKVDINLRNNQGITPLHIAVITMNYTIVKKLLHKKASICLQDNDKNMPIHSLISSPLLTWNIDNTITDPSSLLNYEVFFKLIDPITSLNAKNLYGQTPLHLAIMYGLLDCAIILLSELHADPSICDDNGRNALHYALMFNIENEIIINSLLGNKKCFIKDKFHYTPLHYLLQYCRDDIIYKFQAYSKFVDKTLCINPISLTHIICKIDYEIEQLTEIVLTFCNESNLPIDNEGNTPFHILANNLSSHGFTLKMLCQNYPNLDLNKIYNNIGWSPIHVACNAGNIDFMEYITKSYTGFVLDCNIPTNDHHKYTPAILVSANPCVKLLILLLENGAELHTCDYLNNSPLHYATITQNYPIIHIIVEKNNNFNCINDVNVMGENPLLLACKRKTDIHILNKLIDNNAQLNHFSLENYTGFHWLCFRGDINALQHLSQTINIIDCIDRIRVEEKNMSPPIFSLIHCIIQTKVLNCLKYILSIYTHFDITVDSYGRTPLHLAIISSNENRTMAIELLDYYVKHGINFDVQDSDGYTPIMRALQTTTLYRLDKICSYSKFDIQEYSHGNTPLHIAVQEMEGSNVQYIIDYIDKQTINIQNIEGDTALHLAARLEMEEVVNCLLEAGAEPSVVNNSGETAFQLGWDDDEYDGSNNSNE